MNGNQFSNADFNGIQSSRPVTRGDLPEAKPAGGTNNPEIPLGGTTSEENGLEFKSSLESSLDLSGLQGVQLQNPAESALRAKRQQYAAEHGKQPEDLSIDEEFKIAGFPDLSESALGILNGDFLAKCDNAVNAISSMPAPVRGRFMALSDAEFLKMVEGQPSQPTA